jgi:thiol-disulfide isomerase/thioredoxin
MSFRLSSLDLFRKVPRDLTQATNHGGLLSLAAILLLSAVMMLEIWTYAAGETRSKIVLDQNSESKLQIHFSLSFPELPCRFANVEVWDYLGNSKQDVSGSVEKKVLGGEHGTDVKGQYIHNAIQHRKDDKAVMDLKSDHIIEASHANLATILGQVDYTFVLFYVNWCAFCKTVMPIWHELGLRVRQSGIHRIQIARVDCVTEATLCSETKVAAYPTFMMFKGQHPFEFEYNGHRNVDAFMAYIHQYVAEADANKVDLKEHWHEGCLLSGVLEVNRVPGNFHVTAKSDAHNFDEKSSTC